jgi:hypothetical protein
MQTKLLVAGSAEAFPRAEYVQAGQCPGVNSSESEAASVSASAQPEQSACCAVIVASVSPSWVKMVLSRLISSSDLPLAMQQAREEIARIRSQEDIGITSKSVYGSVCENKKILAE